MAGKGPTRKAFRRREHQREAQAAGDEHERSDADLLAPEHAGGLRRVISEPGLRCIGENRERIQAGDDSAGDERRLPQQPALAHQPQHADDAAAEAVQNACRQARDVRDRLVVRAHFLEAASERFRHVHVMGDFGERVAAHGESHADPGVAELDVFALVDERVIDPPIGPLDARLLEEAVRPEVDGPVRSRARLRNRASYHCVERRAGLILRHLARETVDRAVGLEAHVYLRRFARLEQPHLPAIGCVHLARQQSRERRSSSGFQLDVVLRGAVVGERRGATRLGRDEMQPIGNRGGLLERLLARHLHVEIDEWQRLREITPGEHGADRGQQGKRDPERRPLGDSAHRRFLI